MLIVFAFVALAAQGQVWGKDWWYVNWNGNGGGMAFDYKDDLAAILPDGYGLTSGGIPYTEYHNGYIEGSSPSSGTTSHAGHDDWTSIGTLPPHLMGNMGHTISGNTLYVQFGCCCTESYEIVGVTTGGYLELEATSPPCPK